MKFLITLSVLFFIPIILCAFLFAAVLPLFVQHFFRQKPIDNTPEYPYLTSWEDVA